MFFVMFSKLSKGQRSSRTIILVQFDTLMDALIWPPCLDCRLLRSCVFVLHRTLKPLANGGIDPIRLAQCPLTPLFNIFV